MDVVHTKLDTHHICVDVGIVYLYTYIYGNVEKKMDSHSNFPGR